MLHALHAKQLEDNHQMHLLNYKGNFNGVIHLFDLRSPIFVWVA